MAIIMKKCISSVAFLVICLLVFAACSNQSSFSGKYVIADVMDDPDGITFMEMSKMYKDMDLDKLTQFNERLKVVVQLYSPKR